jgi:hypothetical protein
MAVLGQKAMKEVQQKSNEKKLMRHGWLNLVRSVFLQFDAFYALIVRIMR